MNIGENIKKMRQFRKLTQKELANKLGKTQQFIGKLEKNLNSPNFSTLLDIAVALEIPLDMLLDISPSDTAYFIRAMPDDFDLDKVNTLMDYFDMLNDLGQDKAIERVEELTEIKKYTDPKYTDPDEQ